LASFALMYVATLLEEGVVQKLCVWAFMLLLAVGWNQMWLAVTQLLKAESARVQAFTESAVNFANVAFLLITFSFTDPWTQVPPVACGCLAMLVLLVAWRWLIRGQQKSRQAVDPEKSRQAVDPAVAATAVDVAPSPVSVRSAEPQACAETRSVHTPASRMRGEQERAGIEAALACGATLDTQSVAPLPRARSVNSTWTARTLVSAQSGVFLVSPCVLVARDIMSTSKADGNLSAPAPSEVRVHSAV